MNPDLVLAILQRLHPRQAAPLALHEPSFAGREWEYLRECLDSGWVSSAGAFVERFEAELAACVGVRHAIAVTNGTAALHTCLLLLGVGPGDEVLLPTFTFVATANAVAYCGATPHFVDSEAATLGLDPSRLAEHLAEIGEQRDGIWRNRRTGRRLAAVVPMHTFGHPVDLDGLQAVADCYRLPIVEDAAEALGSFYRGRHVGSRGVLAALSFNGNKIVTCGGGGAVLTDDAELARRARHLTTTARVPHRWELAHDMLGYNYRLPNLNAALGCAQLEQLPRFLARKRSLAARYREAFAAVAGVRFVDEPAAARSNFWLNALLLDDPSGADRDALLARTNEAGILCRPAWTLMHRLPMYRECPRMDLAVAENLAGRLINLPSSASLGAADD